MGGLSAEEGGGGERVLPATPPHRSWGDPGFPTASWTGRRVGSLACVLDPRQQMAAETLGFAGEEKSLREGAALVPPSS